MGNDPIDDRLAAAIELTRGAGIQARSSFAHPLTLTVEQKGVQDRVTNADRQTEKMLRDGLGSRFEDDGMLGEEFGRTPPSGDHDGTWVIDPIDGTDCFLFGIPSWCISVAYVRDGRTEIGIVHDCVHDELYHARLGGGAFVNGKPLSISEATDIRSGLIGIGHSLRVRPSTTLAALERLMAENGMFHRCGSGALSLAWVAAGRLIGYFEPHMNSWDCLAGMLLVREAGGWTNGFLDNDGLTKGNPVFASAPGIVDHIKRIGDYGAGAEIRRNVMVPEGASQP